MESHGFSVRVRNHKFNMWSYMSYIEQQSSIESLSFLGRQFVCGTSRTLHEKWDFRQYAAL